MPAGEAQARDAPQSQCDRLTEAVFSLAVVRGALGTLASDRGGAEGLNPWQLDLFSGAFRHIEWVMPQINAVLLELREREKAAARGERDKKRPRT